MTATATAPDTVATLVELDRELYRNANRSVAVRAVVYAFLGLFVLGMIGLVIIAEAGSARVTTACLLSAVLLGFSALSPLIAGRATGLQPEHVRTLPVSADQYRAAITRRALRQLWAALVPAMLIALAVATSGDSPAAIALAVVGGIGSAILLDLAPRVTGLRFAGLIRTQLGKVIGVVSGVVGIVTVYVVYVLTANQSIDTDNRALQAVVRVLPSGWPAVAAEGASRGRWWPAVLALAGLVAVILLMRRDWSRQIDLAVYNNALAAPSTGSRADRSEARRSSPVALIIRTEARMLVGDSQRLGLLITPVAFIAIGIVLVFTGFDSYGMRYGAPLVVFLMTSTMANSYGLDRWGFATLLTSRRAAPLIIRARMILFASAALLVGLAGTVIARIVRDTDPDTWPVTVAVLVGGVVSGAAATAVLPALAPYRVPTGSGMGSINSRGSMSGRSLGMLFGYLAGFALVCSPGIIIGLAVSGPFAWAAVIVEVAIGIPIVWVAYRWGVRLVHEHGPEILATVTATA
ncbi:hypothetical protein [Williamsia sp. CHRR-6]|uniref:hypothetical protein n=1 Tax=Williamsia sp. CHRR-6 TaxID=2835871 RepID=UPI001BDA0482|nr:hypothetical protein [Williamsia sp. CHRR-6]MBT0565746.1 hypothetical protein [Williamsia sp. CHRR-6]